MLCVAHGQWLAIALGPIADSIIVSKHLPASSKLYILVTLKFTECNPSHIISSASDFKISALLHLLYHCSVEYDLNPFWSVCPVLQWSDCYYFSVVSCQCTASSLVKLPSFVTISISFSQFVLITNLKHFFNVFLSLLYMFRATQCSSSGESIVSIHHLVYITLRVWPSGMQVREELSEMHTRALGCSKRVQKWNKHTKKVRQVGY